MARTRIDPWLTEQPDVVWRQSTLASIIPDLPYFPPSDSQNKTPKTMKVLLPNPLAKSQQPDTNTWSGSLAKPSSSIYHSPHLKPKPFKEAHISSSNMSFKKKETHTSSHSSFKKKEGHISSSHLSFKKKHKSKHLKHRHRSNNEFEAAASKVLAALNMSKLIAENQEPEDFEYEPEAEFESESILKPEPKKIKLMSLPDDDSRKNMIPKVVLRDIGSIITKVCPKLSSSNEVPKSETSACSQAASEKSPASVRSPVSAQSPAYMQSAPSGQSAASAQSEASAQIGASPKSQTPSVVILHEPPVVTLEDVGATNLNTMSASKFNKATTKAMSCERVNQSSVKSHAMSPSKMSKAITKATSCEERSQSLASSEKSFAPFSKKETSFAALASAAPSFSNSPIACPSSFSWPSSLAVLSTKSVESDSSDLSLLPRSPGIDDKTKQSNGIKSHRSRSSLSRVTEKVKTSPPVPPTLRHSTRLVPTTSVPVKNGFLGFAQEDGKKLKVCFHVNTNILASSLDLLDLHKHSEIPSGSPSTCPHCNVTFSSVKHCKYHQSFTSSDVSLAPSRHNNIQENDLWLCPWCPVMATTIMLLNSHKSVCREKGRCHHEEKASSVRKNAPISSSQRNSPTSCTSNGTFTSPSKYKVVHGHVIEL